MGKLYLFLASLLLMLTSSALKAQDSEFIELTLNKMFELADSRNSEISVFETAALKAEEDMQGVKNQYLPSIKASLSFSYNGDGTITDRNFSNSFSVPIPSFGNSFSLEVSQLIYNGGAVKGSIDMAKIQTEVAHLQSKNKLQEVRFMIVGNFMDLCKIENNILVFESHIIQTEKQLSHMQLRYNEGTALLNDITRFELKLQNLQHTLIELKNSKQILNNQLTQALGLPISVTIKPIRDTLVLIEDSEYQLRLAQAEANYRNSLVGKNVTGTSVSAANNNLYVTDAGINEVEIQLDNAQSEYIRYKTLLENGAVTRQQFDAIETTYKSLQAKLETMKHQKQSTSLAKVEQIQRLEQSNEDIALSEAALNIMLD